MQLIDQFLPSRPFREVDRVAVAASPAEAWAAARNVDLYRLGLIRSLFAMRALPERLAARVRGERATLPKSARIDDIGAGGSGFVILGEDPGREVVVGAIGKFWQPAITFARVLPTEFAAFAEPGFGKVAWNVRVDPREPGGSWLSVEVRVGATDPEALSHFKAYWLLIGRFSRLIRRLLLRSLVRELGPASDEAEAVLPGDELLPSARSGRTDAVTIEAPAEAVWPWLVQMGCRRAGWYSYDLLDNGGVTSADHIVAGLQHIHVGDLLPATPTDTAGFAVLRCEAPRVLVLGSPALIPADELGAKVPRFGALGSDYLATWAFVLDPIGDMATRLIVRVRAELEAGPKALLTRALVLPAHIVMEREQLRNIKRRAEGPQGLRA